MTKPLTALAIPTEYAGVEFRSRLEARWAVFFDLLGWKWEYEPIEGDHYLPDFLLAGPVPVFVEVKPFIELDLLRAPLARAVEALGDHYHYDILGLGTSPKMPHNDPFFGFPALGLIAEWRELWTPHPDPIIEKYRPAQDARGFCEPIEAWFARCLPCKRLAIITARTGQEQAPRARPCGHEWSLGHEDQVVAHDPIVVRAAWAHATNEVKWLPPA